MRTIDRRERRHRLARRHHLATPGKDVTTVAGDLLGLHSTDPASVMVGARARVSGFAPEDMERLLYDDRDLARILAMRRTLFVVPTQLVALLHAATTRNQAPTQHRRNVKLIEDGGELRAGTDVAAWLTGVGDRTVAALVARGLATARELTEDVPELAERITVGPGKRWGGQIGVSTRVLFQLATEGRIVRGRPRGSWTSTQYRWATLDGWFDGRVDLDTYTDEDARSELARRWLTAFGPATPEDLQWWTGWTRTATRQALAAIETADVDLDGAPGIALADDLEPTDPPERWVALLPALDTTIMGWKDRRFFLDEDVRARVFDRNGNAGPTVWLDGQVVGGWAQRPDGDVAVSLLRDVGSDAHAAIDAEAEALAAWFGDVRPIPRFRTPLEKELSS